MPKPTSKRGWRQVLTLRYFKIDECDWQDIPRKPVVDVELQEVGWEAVEYRRKFGWRTMEGH